MLAVLEMVTAVGSLALERAARRTVLAVGGLLLCAGLLVASLGFFTLAASRALTDAIGAIYAPLIVGAAYLVFALVALLVVQSRR
jgi:4-amino-4-deoxy-L-arabinose transferase-like glycosyltransferase